MFAHLYCRLLIATFYCCNILQNLTPRIFEILSPVWHDIKSVHSILFRMLFEDLFPLGCLQESFYMHWIRTEQKFNPIIVFYKRRKKYCLYRAFRVVIPHGMLCTNNITKPKAYNEKAKGQKVLLEALFTQTFICTMSARCASCR